MLNFYILAYLITTIGAMLALCYIMLRQFKEVRRPKNTFTRLRWQLFWLPTVILLGLVLGIPRLVESLFLKIESGQIPRVIGGIIVISGFTWLLLRIYTYREKQ